MLYNPPTGATDPSAPYVGKNAAAGTQGSRVPPKAVEAPQRELVALIAEAGLSPTNDDLKQVLRAIRSGKLWTFQDVGTQNAVSIQPPTSHTSVFLGLPFRVIPAASCTGPATFTLGTFAPVPLYRRDGSALVIGDYLVNVPIDVWYDGLGNFRLMDIALGEVPRLVASPTLYVRTDGSDLNDGSANTAAKAFATLAAAIARGTTRYALTGGTLTIQLGNPGNYAYPGAIPATPGILVIQGDQSNQAQYIVSGAGPVGGGGALIFAQGGQVRLRGVTLSNTGSVNHTLNAGATSAVLCEYVTFTSSIASAFGHMQAAGGAVTLGVGCIVNSSMAQIGAAIGAGSVNITQTLTLANTPSFSVASFVAQTGGGIYLAPGAGFTGSGATGPRYSATLNGIIAVYGAGANALPGSSAGSVSTGGQYA